MATTTENLGLTLPAGTDRALVSDLNENFQTLDAFAGQATAHIQEAQKTANAAAPQSTTYTKAEVDTALAAKLNTADVDAALSSTSTNPVQNKAVQAPIARLVDAGAKNLLDFEKWASSIQVVRGTKLVQDGAITITATADSCNTYWSAADFPIESRIPVTEGDKIVLTWKSDNASGVEKGAVYLFGNGSAANLVSTSDISGLLVYTVPPGISFVTWRIGVSSSGDSITYSKMMICTSEDYDISPEFVPYTPTMRELYEMILALQNAQNG